MSTYRRTAIVVGVLYIIGTVAGVLSVIVTGPILGASDLLASVGANANQLTAGASLVLLMGLPLAMVPVMLFPILRKINEVLAVGYVVFRGALETLAYVAAVITWLFLSILGREYAAAGAPDASYFQILGSVLKEGHDAITPILMVVFSLGALMLYYVLWQSKLVPRWISGWGVIAILLHLATGILIVFQLQTAFSPVNMAMNLPIGLQEMVMAAWLIAKGFSPAALASLSAKTATNQRLSAAFSPA